MSPNSRRKSTRWLTSTVFGIGMASLFSDLSHEAVTAVLPALLASIIASASVWPVVLIGRGFPLHRSVSNGGFC